MICDDTAQVLQEMSNVGCMNYGRTRLQEGSQGPHSASGSSTPKSKAISSRSSAYIALHEAVVALKALNVIASTRQ